MNLLTMIFPVLCYASISFLVANANPTFEGYGYETPGIEFEYPTFRKMLPKNADIKPTPTKMTKEKIATKSQLNSATALKATMTTAAAAYQQHHKKTHVIEKIEKSTVINPTAIKETNLNIKSNKNPVTPATITKRKTISETTTETVIKTKPDKLSLNQLLNTSSVSTTTTTNTHLSSAGCCSSYVQREQTNLNFKHKLENNHIKTTDPAVLASQEAALENFLNRDNVHIYRVATNMPQHLSLVSRLPNTQHGTKRLKLKHNVYHADHLNKAATLKNCYKQGFELTLNHPLERRLAPYTETLKQKEYFE